MCDGLPSHNLLRVLPVFGKGILASHESGCEITEHDERGHKQYKDGNQLPRNEYQHGFLQRLPTHTIVYFIPVLNQMRHIDHARRDLTQFPRTYGGAGVGKC